METNPGFEAWLDSKIDQLRLQGKTPTVQRDSRKYAQLGGEHLEYREDIATIGAMQRRPEASSNSKGQGEVDGGADYYKFVWNEDDQTQERVASPQLESPKDVVARILRETEHYAPGYESQANDKGYVKFKSRPHQGRRGEEMAFHEFTREAGDGESETHSPSDPHSPPSSVQVAFRKYHDSNMTHDVYLDDDIAGEFEFSKDGDSRARALLPMDIIEMELESEEEETMLDAEPNRNSHIVEPSYADTQPIVTVDQAKLTEKFLKRKQRLRVVVVVGIIVLCIAAFAVITYLVVHFLSKAQ